MARELKKERRKLERELYEIHQTIAHYDRGGKVKFTAKCWGRMGKALNELLDLARRMKKHGIDGYANSVYMLVDVMKDEVNKDILFSKIHKKKGANNGK